ncbi:MAG TPA: hypothetical protein VII98_00160 [Solirubrobacteraceae bacterium]
MRAQTGAPQRQAQRSSAAAAAPRNSAAHVLRLQRLAGNRATARMLARWTRHPDADKKGVVVPDVVAEEFDRFNPPKNA